jgi:pimeloyl-ACP methyl ester carboxylesterase
MTNAPIPSASPSHYRDAANRFVTVDKIRFAYRELGPRGGKPLVPLNHWGAVLDNFDPRIVDGLAAAHHVIAGRRRALSCASLPRSRPGGVRPRRISGVSPFRF